MPIPSPEAGLVISYAYLWSSEHDAGLEEGRKDRPSVVILKVQVAADITRVVVLPITHSRPLSPDDAIEIPRKVARSVGLDERASWIVISEGNEFAWPGYDLRQARTDRFDLGFLPPRFFSRLLKKSPRRRCFVIHFVCEAR